ncbi:MAG: hypothetical protein GX968_01720 [Tissierellia bacterium]|nr:hypothetical protein [Tissierellia bacterium]
MQEGFEDSVRTRMGVKKSELTDTDIRDKFIAELAETVTIKRVPEYGKIVDEKDLMFLESAVNYYICYLLAPTMPNKIKYKVSTIEVKWEKLKTDWEKRAEEFLALYEEALSQIESVNVLTVQSEIFHIAKMTRGGE